MNPRQIDFQILTKKNFLTYMASHYEETLDEDQDDFHDDLQRIKYIKRLLSKYEKTGILKTRLLINHIVILMNTLGPFATTRVLLYKIEPHHHEVISAFLHSLNALTDALTKEMSVDNYVCDLIQKEMR